MESSSPTFILPIEYDCRRLSSTIIDDLELIKLIDTHADADVDADLNKEKSLYECVFNPTTDLAHQILPKMAQYYTTNTSFLKEQQQLIQTLMKNTDNDDGETASVYIQPAVDVWRNMKSETAFCEKYSFIQWDFAKFLNQNTLFMQLLSIYSIGSPLITLCLPFCVLLVPFFILKLKQIPITLADYGAILKSLIQTNSLFQLATSFSQMSMDKLAYCIVSGAFYLFSMYQNLLSCVRFYLNMRDIHAHLFCIRDYLSGTLERMRKWSNMLNSFKTTAMKKFRSELDAKCCVVENWLSRLNVISPFSAFSLTTFKQFGTVLSTFYTLYVDDEWKDLLNYTFGFHGYVELMQNIATQISTGAMNFVTKWSKKGSKMRGVFYPKFLDENQRHHCVQNNVSLKQNLIITAPNGGGKTTLLKTIMINHLLCQQFGVGCFQSATISPFTHFHCYLNIPDTSGRDSLFQAEARRCKLILDTIVPNDKVSKDKRRHLCIFDELYSGTNPDEAVKAATAFMRYLIKPRDNCHVTCLLTTHYTKLCENLDGLTNMKNMHMGVRHHNGDGNDDNKGFSFTYCLEKGMSTVKGGMQVLREMNYPKEIIEDEN